MGTGGAQVFGGTGRVREKQDGFAEAPLGGVTLTGKAELEGPGNGAGWGEGLAKAYSPLLPRHTPRGQLLL